MSTSQRSQRSTARSKGSGGSSTAAPPRSTPQIPGHLSRAAENYLLSLSILQEDGVAPHISQLAAYLRHLPPEEEVGTTLASVSGMVHRMSRESLVTINKAKEIHLTPEGERRSHHIVRRHRMAERLLADLLDVPLERAEIEAHQLEHSISPDLLVRIEEKLGYPTTCPFGRPIYRADETGRRREEPGTISLAQAKKGAEYTVVRIPDEDYPLLRFLVENKILPGYRVRVEENAPYRGVVELRRDSREVSVGMEVAERMRVRPA